MTNPSSLVQDHYTHGGLLERILAFLEQAGIDPEKMNPADLFACDQMHTRGIAATREHVERAGIGPGMRVLDVGCGIGGSARFISTACDCQVTGIDLTQELIDVARELTSRCGLDGRIEFFQADALDMPFEDATFDHVWSHNVIMNIEDKSGLFAEIARVLRSGGRTSCSEFVRGPGAEPIYPLPWASDASSSFLPTPDEMRAAMESEGLHVVEQIDLNETNQAFFKEMSARAERGEPPLGINPQAFKSREDFMERVRNSGRSAREGRLAEQFFLSEKA